MSEWLEFNVQPDEIYCMVSHKNDPLCCFAKMSMEKQHGVIFMGHPVGDSEAEK